MPRQETCQTACPTHAELALAFAQGRLAQVDEAKAERTLAECAICRTWWEGTLDHPEVARGVADGLAAFRVPAEQRAAAHGIPHRWTARGGAALRAAAVLLLVVGAGTAWLASGGPGAGDVAGGVSPAGSEAAQVAGEVIVAEGLEDGGPGTFDAHTLETRVDQPAVIFRDDLESGSLDAWRNPS